MVIVVLYNINTGHSEVLERWTGTDTAEAIHYIASLLSQQPHDCDCLYFDLRDE